MDGCKQVGIEWNGTDHNTTHTPCVRRCCAAKLAIILEGERARAGGGSRHRRSSSSSSCNDDVMTPRGAELMSKIFGERRSSIGSSDDGSRPSRS